MTNKQLDNRVKKLQGIEAQMKEAALPDVFATYSRESISRRFTIA